jgi:drug/metabolite transporter (DMT)-like permease
MSVRAFAAALVTVALWGSAFVAIRDAGKTFSPGSLAFGRLLVALVFLTVAARLEGRPLPPRRDRLRIAGYGVLWLGVYSFSVNAAERRVDAGTAAMLINTGPILIAILAGVFLSEGLPRRLLLGCAVAFTGCVLIGAGNMGTGARGGLGIALLIVAALAYAISAVIQKSVVARTSVLQITWLACIAAAAACSVFTLRLIDDVRAAPASAIGWIVYLGVGPTALGFVTWAYALSRMTAGRLASLAYLIPVVAILLGWGVLGETPPGLAVAGGALCVGGVALARG